MAFDFGGDPANALDMVLVTCTVSKGDFPFHITWLLNNNQLISGQNGVVITTSKRTSQLSIESVSYENQGLYTCIVTNMAGSTNYSAELTVNGKLHTL